MLPLNQTEGSGQAAPRIGHFTGGVAKFPDGLTNREAIRQSYALAKCELHKVVGELGTNLVRQRCLLLAGADEHVDEDFPAQRWILTRFDESLDDPDGGSGTLHVHW